MLRSQSAAGDGAAVAVADTVDEPRVDRRGLAYTIWPPLVQSETRQAVVLVDSGPVCPTDDLLRELRVDGFTVVWWSGANAGDADAAERLTMSATAHALDRLTRAVSDDHRIAMKDIAIVGQGAAALSTLTWAHDYAPRVRCVIAASSGLLWEAGPSRVVEDDGTCITRVVRDADAIDVPLRVLLSDGAADDLRRAGDVIVKRRAAAPAAAAVVAGDPSRLSVRQTAQGRLRQFLRDVFDRPFERPSLLNAHEDGFTKAELDGFLQPLPLLSKRRLQFAFSSASIKTLGLLSTGMRIGLRTGFDSGSSMEYVYANVPSGVTALGRKLDESYLNSPGWIAIRVRRRNVQRLIAETARRIQNEGRELHVVDIAAGHGRYVMDALLELPRRPDSVRLHEYVDENVQRGGALLRECGLDDIAIFVHGDAFDGPTLAALRPRPTLAIACGIYELFPDNAQVIRSLVGLSRAMERDSYLVYTNQPWQPLLEFFVRVVPSHREDERCVARRRTQAEIDQLVEHAGFTKVSQTIDPQGIFSVSVARKVSHPRSHF